MAARGRARGGHGCRTGRIRVGDGSRTATGRGPHRIGAGPFDARRPHPIGAGLRRAAPGRATAGRDPSPPGGRGRRTIPTRSPRTGRRECPRPPAPGPRGLRRRPSRSRPRPGSLGRAQGGEAAPQDVGAQETPLRVDVLGRRGRDRARDVSAHPVDRLHVPSVALGRPRVQEQPRARVRRRAVGVEQSERARLRPEVARVRRGHLLRQLALPGREAPVQDPHVPMARPAEQPPGAGRGPAEASVVDDDRCARRDARPAHRAPEDLRVGQRVPPSLPHGPRQLGVQVDVDRAGEVPGLVRRASGRAAQRPADVKEDRRPGPGRLAQQFACGDDGLHGCHPRAAARPPGTNPASSPRPSPRGTPLVGATGARHGPVGVTIGQGHGHDDGPRRESR